MREIWNRLMEEPAMLGVALVILVRRIVAPLIPMPEGVEDGIIDLVTVLAGVGVRAAVTPTRKRDRLAEERQRRGGAPRMAGNPGERG